MDVITVLLQGFWTVNTPLSFLAGIGAHHLYAKYWRDRKNTMFKKDANGNNVGFSTRFWVYSVIATVIICWIGWRTQDTANKVEHQARDTTAFAAQTNDCLTQLITVLTTRVGYNEQINALDLRRQAIWERLVTDLSVGNGNEQLNREALDRFFQANQVVKTDQAALAEQREQNQYPDPECGKEIP